MPLELNWVGDDQLDRVAETRHRCFSAVGKDLPAFRERMGRDRRLSGGDFLLAEEDGHAVGTASSLRMTMWLRGAPMSCQGVAWVGVIKSHRRRGSGERPGIASEVMREVVREARRREHVVSALMPFRASFYEHFGYGVVERRAEWRLPLDVMPRGGHGGFAFYSPTDEEALRLCRQEMVRRGQCDIERDDAAWNEYRVGEDAGFTVVDRATDGSVRSWMLLVARREQERSLLRVQDWCARSPADLAGMLSFLGSLRDQYSCASIDLPPDLPAQWLLRERQVPHRPVEHPTAQIRLFTRMQVRVLNHRRFLESLHLPPAPAGRAVIAVHEVEGEISRFEATFEAGRVQVRPSESAPDIEMPDHVWAAVACGEPMSMPRSSTA